MIRILNYENASSLIRRKSARLEEAERIVAPIVADVRERGDAALLEYARRFDAFEGSSVRMRVEGSLSAELKSAVETAAQNIRECAQAQLPRDRTFESADAQRLGEIGRCLGEIV